MSNSMHDFRFAAELFSLKSNTNHKSSYANFDWKVVNYANFDWKVVNYENFDWNLVNYADRKDNLSKT